MKIDLHLYLHDGPQNPSTQDIILNALHCLEIIIMGALTDLETAVAENTDVTQSAVTLLEGLKTKLDEAIANGDPAALEALSAALGADTTKLAAAVAAHTVVAEDPNAP